MIDPTYDLIVDRVVPGLTWEMRPDGKCFISVPSIPLGDIELPENRHRVVRYLADQTNRMVNAFRHRLDILARQRDTADKAN